MKKIGIIGGTGYTGSELCRILSVHPEAEIASITSRNNAGKKVSDVHPFLKGYVDIDFSERVSTDVDLVFVATPHGVAMNEIPGLMDLGIKCIDLSGDYRMHDIPTYEKWYGHKHTDPEHLKDAVYGLPELFRKDIKGADLVANPGCYATASILACAPLMKAGVAEPMISIDAKSGTSGAGMVPSARTHHATCSENVIPYGVGTHRHTPEIEMALKMFSGRDSDVLFVPTLIPIIRGILSTCYITLNKDLTQEEVEEIYQKQYRPEPFVLFRDDPSIRGVVGSNHAEVGAKVYGNRAVVFGSVDNLVKGASGQAIQCMNLMLGLDETMGLNFPGLGV